MGWVSYDLGRADGQHVFDGGTHVARFNDDPVRGGVHRRDVQAVASHRSVADR